MRCSSCQRFFVRRSLPEVQIFQPSLTTLKSTAQNGCDLCLLFFSSLVRDNSPEAIGKHLDIIPVKHGGDNDAMAIKVHVQLADNPRQKHEALPRPELQVYSGKSGLDETVPYINSTLSVFARTDNPAVHHCHGREVSVDPAADSLFATIRHWLSFCDNNHPFCHGSPSKSVLPTRYLDVGPTDGSIDPNLRLNPDSTHIGRYVALSYAWGPYQQFVTTRANLEALTHSIPLSELAQSLQDAIFVTQKLGLRFLWIDALCIVQQEPDLADFMREAPKMGQYYTNAYLTISAGCSADSRQGFLSPRPAPMAPPCALDYHLQPSLPSQQQPQSQSSSIPQVSTLYATIQPTRTIGPLTSRAWTLQEASLSPRALVYGLGQTFFICQTARHFEDGSIAVTSWSTSDHDHVLPNLTVTSRLPGGNLTDDPRASEVQRRDMLRRWLGTVEAYSLRYMKEERDKLSALAGMAARIGAIVGCRYFFGIWEGDLARGLLWRSTVMWLPHVYRVPLRRPAGRAPSWSWASVDGPVCFEKVERAEGKFERALVKMKECVVGKEVWDPIRSGVGFELVVEGVLKGVRKSKMSCGEYKLSKRVHWRPAMRMMAQGLLEGVLLEADAAKPESELEEQVVGLGLFDVLGEGELVKEFCVLPVVADEGLLLANAGAGRFRRIGYFWSGNQNWFSQGEASSIILT